MLRGIYKRSRYHRQVRKQCPSCSRKIGLSGYKNHLLWHLKQRPDRDSYAPKPNPIPEGTHLTSIPPTQEQMRHDKKTFMNGFLDGFNQGFQTAKSM